MPSIPTTIGDLELEVYFTAHTDGDGVRPDWLVVVIEWVMLRLGDVKMAFTAKDWPDGKVYSICNFHTPENKWKWDTGKLPTWAEVEKHCEPLCLAAERERRAEARAERSRHD